MASCFAPALGLGFVDQSGVQVRVDRHLLAGQGIQSEARRDFGDAHRAVVDDDVLDRDQHQEDHRADDVVAAHHEAAERLDHLAGGDGAGVAVEQDQARRRNIQRQAEQRQQQQRGGKDVNSTGRTGTATTISTMTDIRMSVTIRRSSTKPRQRRDQRDHDRQHGDRHRHLAAASPSGSRSVHFGGLPRAGNAIALGVIA